MLKGRRILVIDDVADVRYMLDRLLSLFGADVTLVSSATEALDGLADGAPPDLILSDLCMPGINGFELMQALDQHRDARIRKVPVLAMSSLHAADVKGRVSRAGFAGFVSKPLNVRELVAAITATTP